MSTILTHSKTLWEVGMGFARQISPQSSGERCLRRGVIMGVNMAQQGVKMQGVGSMLFRALCLLAALVASANAQQVTSLPPVNTTSLAATLVVKAAPGTLYSIYATNLTGGTSGYLVLYNATAAPTPGALTGALVLDCVPFNSLGEASVSYQGYPAKTFDKGIVALVTSATTCLTYTTGVLTAYISAIRQ